MAKLNHKTSTAAPDPQLYRTNTLNNQHNVLGFLLLCFVLDSTFERFVSPPAPFRVYFCLVPWSGVHTAFSSTFILSSFFDTPVVTLPTQ